MKTLEDYNKAINAAYEKYTDLIQEKKEFLANNMNSYLNKYIKVTMGDDPYFIMHVTYTEYNDEGECCLKGPKLLLSGSLWDFHAVFYPSDWPDVNIEVITKEEYLELFHKTITKITMELQ